MGRPEAERIARRIDRAERKVVLAEMNPKGSSSATADEESGGSQTTTAPASSSSSAQVVASPAQQVPAVVVAFGAASYMPIDVHQYRQLDQTRTRIANAHAQREDKKIAARLNSANMAALMASLTAEGESGTS